MALFAVWGLAAGEAAGSDMPHAGQLDSHFDQNCSTADCHPHAPAADAVPHPPYLENNCLACHEDHASSATALLKPDVEQVCLACHTQVHPEARPAADHPPGSGDCLRCHQPHQSPTRGLLRDAEVLGICADCHRPFLEEAATLPYRHRHFDLQGQCGNCHYAHREAEASYLRAEVTETCLTCHDLPIQSGGRTLENVARELREQPVVHAAIDEGCPTCHTPHGSVQPALLHEGYPAGNYGAYEEENYRLCWRCHDAGLVEQADGRGATEFRDGAKNLHRVHVANLKRGRTCHLCHEAHAADRPHLLRRTMKFGAWEGPLEWRETEGGGSCQTPCHREAGYGRQ